MMFFTAYTIEGAMILFSVKGLIESGIRLGFPYH